MKDPLQTRPSSYEILEIAEDADGAAINDAFKRAMTQGKDIADKTRAQGTLKKGISRAAEDLYLYNDAFLGRLVPDPRSDRAALSAGRARTAQAWTERHKAGFPDMAAIHTLALLWYWWAYSLEEQALAGAAADMEATMVRGEAPIDSDALWAKAISCWTYIINSADFWKEWLATKSGIPGYLGPDGIEGLQAQLAGHFHNLFIGLGDRFSKAGNGYSAARFKRYELLFGTEMKIARTFNQKGLRFNRHDADFAISCGRLMLEEVGLLGTIREQLERLLASNPGNAELEELARSLSPNYSIQALLDDKRYEEALEAVEALGELARDAEVGHFLSIALRELGKVRLDANRRDEALANFRRCLEVTSQAAEDAKDIHDACRAKANSLKNRDAASAIALLDGVLEISSDSDTKALLGELLRNEGVKLINEAQAKITDRRSGDRAGAIAALKQGVDMLRKAAAAGQSEAAKELEFAANLLQTAESGLFDLSEEVTDLIQKAEEEAGAGNLDLAISILNKVLLEIDDRVKPHVRKRLAAFQNSRGVEYANKASGLADAKKLEEAKKFMNAALGYLVQANANDADDATIQQNLESVSAIVQAMNGNYAQVGGLQAPSARLGTTIAAPVKRRRALASAREFMIFAFQNLWWLVLVSAGLLGAFRHG